MWTAAVVVAWLAALVPPALAKGPSAAAQERVGPVWASSAGRAQVRSDRPDGNALHVAWVAPPHVPDWELHQALAAFERASFPEGGAAPSLIEAPPEPWMAELERPALPVRWNDRLVDYLRYFRDRDPGRALMRGWLRRAGRYERRLRAILREVGVPEDLVFVALAESGFDPRVRSRVGAAGLWQFMEATGNVYGLHQDFWVDDRFDVEKSSYAAAAYLTDLHARFGSWELALAAYNAGYGLVMKAIERHNTNSFWALAKIESGLPYATVNYVPKIVAAALVGRNRGALGYGPKDLTPDAELDWVEVKLARSTSLSELARLLDTDASRLAEINAAFIRGRTPPERPTTVRIPRDKAQAFAAVRPELEALWRSEGTVTVKHGEALAAIAKRHGITEKQLRTLNGIRDAAEVVGGVVLVVPVDPPPTSGHAAAGDPEPLPLAAVPELVPGPGQRLVFLETNRASTPPDLERALGVRWSDLVRWNDLDPRARLQSGLWLQVLVPEGFDASARNVEIWEPAQVEHVVRGSRAHLEAELRRRGKVRRGYRARSGDTLAKIGTRFDLTVGDLSRINQVPRERDPTVGDLLVVYVDPKHTKGTVTAPAPIGFEGHPSEDGVDRAPSTAESARVPRGKPGRGDEGHTTKAEARGRKASTAETAGVPGAKDGGEDPGEDPRDQDPGDERTAEERVGE
ncbi:transglycosylase SLT domain-containing protein [Paraliomyxa miuraensis]|uniref:transglycosylase SLT domain-containing protein n=1 Tax=Paraliomyxa miuraensis TaxID=376150 RepID=UPI00225AA735|nr:transglycosylase SLT domain-containing protein [Paraliomyxa miuraensis]MCX4243197.1 transglycosylase SLT domain-containing protein [Paraliomyxa miuraensis]